MPRFSNYEPVHIKTTGPPAIAPPKEIQGHRALVRYGTGEFIGETGKPISEPIMYFVDLEEGGEIHAVSPDWLEPFRAS